MKTKGARLTTEISLPGRFVVYVRTATGSASRAGSRTTSATA
jgi:Ribonucleases G and E